MKNSIDASRQELNTVVASFPTSIDDLEKGSLNKYETLVTKVIDESKTISTAPIQVKKTLEKLFSIGVMAESLSQCTRFIS